MYSLAMFIHAGQNPSARTKYAPQTPMILKVLPLRRLLQRRWHEDAGLHWAVIRFN